MIRCVGVLLVVGLLALSNAASATVVVEQSIEEMATGATSVIHGKVASVRPVSADHRWMTQIVLTVTERIKRDPADIDILPTVGFIVPGGGDGELAQLVPGAPQFTVGEEVVVFLWRGPDSTNRLLGLSQGTFRITRNDSDNPPTPRATSDRRGIATVRRPTTVQNGPVPPILHGEVLELPLEQLFQRIRDAMKSVETP